jgi:prepilin-type processing-associated H-X9-DG protein
MDKKSIKKKKETVTSFGLRESVPEVREWTGHPLEMILGFADGHVEHAEGASVGFNHVMVCETGIVIIAGKLLNGIKDRE